MQPDNHPGGERLAALAASERDAVSDRAMATHVAGCRRCSPIVEELRTLRAALAELPDVPPSRPLRFLPPVPEPTPVRSGWLGALRTLTAPAMAVAAVLIVVGAFGSAASSGFLGAAGSGAGMPSLTSRDDRAGAADGSKATLVPAQGGLYGQSPAAAPSTKRLSGGAVASPAPGSAEAFTPAPVGSQRPPYEWVLGAGVVLLAAAFAARGYVRRRSLA